MEMGASYRKRFLWQRAESELTSIQVAIKRRNLVNPIKTTAPLDRDFDPKRHSLIVHFNRKNIPCGSIFNVQGVVCNKEITPDRSLNRHRQNKSSDQSSDNSGDGSVRISSKNSHPKCCRDLFLRDDLKMKISQKSSCKNISSKERADGHCYNKDIENRASTSGYNITHNRRSRSSTSHSSGSVDFPPYVHHKQRVSSQQQQNYIESKQKQKQKRYKSYKGNNDSDLEEQLHASRTSYSIRYQRSKQRERNTSVHDEDMLYMQKQKSSKSTSSKLSRDRIRRSTRSKSTTKNRSERRSTRSKSTSAPRMSYKSTRLRRSRSRSLTPLRPGEYRPGKRKRLSSPSIGRPSRDGTTSISHHARQQHLTPDRAFVDYTVAPSHIPMPPFQPPYPPFAGQLPSRIYQTRASSVFPPPFIQYLPVVAHHGGPRGPPYAPTLYQPGSLYQPMRPPKVYNNRPIPYFGATPQLRRTTSAGTPGDAPTAHERENGSLAIGNTTNENNQQSDNNDPTSTTTATSAQYALPHASTLDTRTEVHLQHELNERGGTTLK